MTTIATNDNNEPDLTQGARRKVMMLRLAKVVYKAQILINQFEGK